MKYITIFKHGNVIESNVINALSPDLNEIGLMKVLKVDDNGNVFIYSKKGWRNIEVNEKTQVRKEFETIFKEMIEKRQHNNNCQYDQELNNNDD